MRMMIAAATISLMVAGTAMAQEGGRGSNDSDKAIDR